tara:strand:- start:2457 stop:2765 length:309 start_codon:yes stop_codon:yes gene_type:complete
MMNSNKTVLVLTAAVTCFMLSGCASSKPEPAPKVNRFDVDGDGFLTRAEYSSSELSKVIEFDALDSDGDGLLSQRELEFRAGGGSRERGPRDGGRRGGSRLT